MCVFLCTARGDLPLYPWTFHTTSESRMTTKSVRANKVHVATPEIMKAACEAAELRKVAEHTEARGEAIRVAQWALFLISMIRERVGLRIITTNNGSKFYKIFLHETSELLMQKMGVEINHQTKRKTLAEVSTVASRIEKEVSNLLQEGFAFETGQENGLWNLSTWPPKIRGNGITFGFRAENLLDASLDRIDETLQDEIRTARKIPLKPHVEKKPNPLYK